jgi:hypothetical protein
LVGGWGGGGRGSGGGGCVGGWWVVVYISALTPPPLFMTLPLTFLSLSHFVLEKKVPLHSLCI